MTADPVPSMEQGTGERYVTRTLRVRYENERMYTLLSTYESNQSSPRNDLNDSIKSINQLNIFVNLLGNLLFR